MSAQKSLQDHPSLDSRVERFSKMNLYKYKADFTTLRDDLKSAKESLEYLSIRSHTNGIKTINSLLDQIASVEDKVLLRIGRIEEHMLSAQDISSSKVTIDPNGLHLKPLQIPSPKFDVDSNTFSECSERIKQWGRDLRIPRDEATAINDMLAVCVSEKTFFQYLLEDPREGVVPGQKEIQKQTRKQIIVYLVGVMKKLGADPTREQKQKLLESLYEGAKQCYPTWAKVAQERYEALYLEGDASKSRKSKGEEVLLKLVQDYKEKLFMEIMRDLATHQVDMESWHLLNLLRENFHEKYGLPEPDEYDVYAGSREQHFRFLMGQGLLHFFGKKFKPEPLIEFVRNGIAEVKCYDIQAMLATLLKRRLDLPEENREALQFNDLFDDDKLELPKIEVVALLLKKIKVLDY